jgi:iron complex transport system substrate-binding protein
MFWVSVTVAQEGFPRTVTDGLGREVTLEKMPERIVCFCSLGALAALELKPLAVIESAVSPSERLSVDRYFPGFLDGITVIDEDDNYQADPEQVIALEPDLIITYYNDELLSVWEGIAPVYVDVAAYSYQDGVDKILRAYGELFDRTERAEAAIDTFYERLEAYKKLAPGDRSVMVAGASDVNVYVVRTENSTDCNLLNEVARCAWPDPTGGDSWSYETTSETVVDLDPDVLYLANWSELETSVLLSALEADPLMQETTALKNGRVHNLEGYDNPKAEDYANALLLLDTMLPLVYPEVFPEALTDEQVQEILSSN